VKDTAMQTPDARFILLASFCILSALGCGSSEFVHDDSHDDGKLRSLSPADACVDERQIAFKANSGACPMIPDWSATKLFGGAAGELDDYCRYTWTGAGAPTSVDIAAIGAHPGIVSHEADCEIVHEQGTDALTNVYAPLLEAMFRESINAPDPSDLDLPASEALRSPVTVTVVDTTPGDASNPRSIHGDAMLDIVDTIACPLAEGACAVETQRVLGLPRYELGGPADATRGGHFGSLADLAVGIHSAVTEWEVANAVAGVPSKLVINLSVGWDPTSFGSGPAEQAVRAAVEAAYCKGAIILAAAGNSSDMCSSGALLPGAWETAPRPNHARCNALIPGAPAPSSDGYRPLVFAVGGVDRSKAAFSKARSSGTPRLNATADHVRAGGSTVALTGTSTATAAVSGAAALLWSYNPQLQPGQVMDAVYAGSPLGTGMADFAGHGATDLRVRTLDTCSALDVACHGYACASLPLFCRTATPETTTADLVAAAEAIAPGQTVSFNFDEAQLCSDSCGVDHYGHAATSAPEGLDPCPPVADPVEMFVHPQPTQPSCPNCTLKVGSGEATVIATLDSEWSDHTLIGVYVTVYDGVSYYSYDLGAPAIDSSSWSRLIIEDRVPELVRSASILMYFDSGERSSSALIVD
jgi:hypothetical protein